MDYFDDPWPDPFAKPGWTQRQQRYADALKLGPLYTPMLLVMGGGATSSAGDAAHAAAAALAEMPVVDLSVAGELRGKTVMVRAKAAPRPGASLPGTVKIYAAIAEDRLTTTPARGENAGRALAESGVVRVLLPPQAPGPALEWTADLGADWNPGNLRAVVFLQDAATLRVLEAAEADIRSR